MCQCCCFLNQMKFVQVVANFLMKFNDIMTTHLKEVKIYGAQLIISMKIILYIQLFQVFRIKKTDLEFGLCWD